MIDFLKKYSKIIYIILSILCVIVGLITKQWYLYLSAVVLLLMALGILKDDEK